MKRPAFLLFLSLSAFFAACNNGDNNNGEGQVNRPPVPMKTWNIVSSIPHDTSYFTQGYEFYKDNLIVGTGNYGASRLMRIEPATGKVLQNINLPDSQFGEGITVLNDTIYQLTWREHIIHMYHAENFKKIGEARLATEGWGATNNGEHILVSNGSNQIFFYEPYSFQLARTIQVTEAGVPAVNLNELEFADGFIYANQWQYNYILKIDPASGEIVAKYDLSDLVRRIQQEHPYLDTRNNAVLNGIAYNSQTGRFFITGKLWPQAFEIQLAP